MYVKKQITKSQKARSVNNSFTFTHNWTNLLNNVNIFIHATNVQDIYCVRPSGTLV